MLSTLTRRTSRWMAAPVLATAALLAPATTSQAATTTDYLVASDPVADARLGRAVAFSGDGSTAVVSSDINSTSSTAPGATYVYLNPPTGNPGAIKQTQRLLPPANAGETSSSGFGAGVATSGDGRTIAVSAPTYGHIYFFKRATGATTWTYTTMISQAAGAANFGQSMGLSADGTRLLVSGANTLSSSSTSNSAYYYTLSSAGSWTLQSTLTDAVAGSRFGTAVALSADGTTAAVTAPRYNTTVSGHKTYQPRVTMYSVSATNLTQTRVITDPSNLNYISYFGVSVSLSRNGTDIAIGAPGVYQLPGSSSVLAGAAFAAGSGTGWAVSALTTPSASSSGAAEQLGASVALSPDGLIVGAGAPGSGGQSLYWSRTATTAAFPNRNTGTLARGNGSDSSGYALTFGPAKTYISTVLNGTYTGAPSQSGFALKGTIS